MEITDLFPTAAPILTNRLRLGDRIAYLGAPSVALVIEVAGFSENNGMPLSANSAVRPSPNATLYLVERPAQPLPTDPDTLIQVTGGEHKGTLLRFNPKIGGYIGITEQGGMTNLTVDYLTSNGWETVTTTTAN